MTILQPDRVVAVWNRVLIGLGIMLLLASVYLVRLYTELVTLNHGAEESKAELQELQAENSELKDAVFALWSEEGLQAFAAERGLVVNRDPHYLTVGASRTPGTQSLAHSGN